MMRTSVSLLSALSLLALGSVAKAQVLACPNGGTDTVAAFSPIDARVAGADAPAVLA